MPPSDPVLDVLRARLQAVKVTAGKIAAAEAYSVGGRLTHMFGYWAAHTGRWVGRGPQLQNLPRAIEGMPEDLTPGAAPAWAEATGHPLERVLGAMLRGALVADPGRLLLVVDFSQVEARCVLWFAGDQEGLRRFEGDPYRAMAARVYGVEPAAITKLQRQLGKLLVLGAGYGGGVPAMQRSAAKQGIPDLAAFGVDPQAAVESWRDAHPLVAGERSGGAWTDPDGRLRIARKGGLWKRLKRVLHRLLEGGRTGEVAGCRFDRDPLGGHLRITLPSGRPLVYRNARMQLMPSRWSAESQLAAVWDSPRGLRTLWHGALVENLSQATCRDLLTAAMLRVEASGLGQVLAHTHDDLVVSVASEADAQQVVELIAAPPPWAVGFPIAVSAEIGERYA